MDLVEVVVHYLLIVPQSLPSLFMFFSFLKELKHSQLVFGLFVGVFVTLRRGFSNLLKYFLLFHLGFPHGPIDAGFLKWHDWLADCEKNLVLKVI